MSDVAVVSGPARRELDATAIGGWTREWGLLVPDGNPDSIGGVADLVERDRRFVNRDADSGLRATFDERLASFAAERGANEAAIAETIDGYDLTVKAHESPARLVDAGKAEVGLGLRATASKLGLGFVAVGNESVRVLANPDRTGKPGVEALRESLDSMDDVLASLEGYRA